MFKVSRIIIFLKNKKSSRIFMKKFLVKEFKKFSLGKHMENAWYLKIFKIKKLLKSTMNYLGKKFLIKKFLFIK